VPTHDLNPADDPWASTVVLHPHPSYGGDRFNNVVTALYLALPSIGVSASRFDFSSDDVDRCTAETIDVLEAVEPAPRFLVAYSFGGGVAATITDERVAGWVLIAPGLSLVTPAIGDDARPKLVLAGAHDQFFSQEGIADATAGWTATENEVIEGADHFFVGRTDAIVAAVLPWLERLRPVA
jgi:alpha/beta superfamily hydrolase